MSLNIRRATPADAVLLPDIERAAGQLFLAIPGLEWIADDVVMLAEQHAEAIAAGPCLVAETDHVIGFLCAQLYPDALHVREVSIHPDARGQRIGAQLIEAATSEAFDAGLAAVTLTTFRNVPWNAPYYERLGFERLSRPELNDRLRSVLADEVRRGLPVSLRCAMRRRLP